MKKLLMFLLLIYSAHLTNGQSFYIKASTGYAFPLGSNDVGEKRSTAYLRETDPESGIYLPALTSNSKVVTGSYSSGVVTSVTLAYMLSENVGLEGSASYIHGKKYRSNSVHHDIIDEVITNTSQANTVDRAKSFVITPSIRISAGSNKKLMPFLSAGPAISFSKLVRDYERHSDFNETPQNMRRTEKYSGGVSIGFRSALGLELKLSERLSIFSEMTIMVLSYYPHEMELTRYVLDDEDLLSSLNESQRKTHYLKNYESDTRTNSNINESPTQALRFSFGMNNIAAMSGLKMHL